MGTEILRSLTEIKKEEQAKLDDAMSHASGYGNYVKDFLYDNGGAGRVDNLRSPSDIYKDSTLTPAEKTALLNDYTKKVEQATIGLANEKKGGYVSSNIDDAISYINQLNLNQFNAAKAEKDRIRQEAIDANKKIFGPKEGRTQTSGSQAPKIDTYSSHTTYGFDRPEEMQKTFDYYYDKYNGNLTEEEFKEAVKRAKGSKDSVDPDAIDKYFSDKKTQEYYALEKKKTDINNKNAVADSMKEDKTPSKTNDKGGSQTSGLYKDGKFNPSGSDTPGYTQASGQVARTEALDKVAQNHGYKNYRDAAAAAEKKGISVEELYGDKKTTTTTTPATPTTETKTTTPTTETKKTPTTETNPSNSGNNGGKKYTYANGIPSSAKPSESQIVDSKPITSKVVSDVMEGKYGTGQDRAQKLTDAGYDYQKVQTSVNKKIYGNDSSVKLKIDNPKPTSSKAKTQTSGGNNNKSGKMKITTGNSQVGNGAPSNVKKDSSGKVSGSGGGSTPKTPTSSGSGGSSGSGNNGGNNNKSGKMKITTGNSQVGNGAPSNVTMNSSGKVTAKPTTTTPKTTTTTTPKTTTTTTTTTPTTKSGNPATVGAINQAKKTNDGSLGGGAPSNVKVSSTGKVSGSGGGSSSSNKSGGTRSNK